MLYCDLLLSSAPVVIKPFGQHHDRPCRLVGELEIFRPRLDGGCAQPFEYIASDASFARLPPSIAQSVCPRQDQREQCPSCRDRQLQPQR